MYNPAWYFTYGSLKLRQFIQYFYHFLDEGLGDAIELRRYGEAGRDILEIIKTKLNLL